MIDKVADLSHQLREVGLKTFSKRKPRKRKFLMLNREAKPTREQDLNLISILLKNRAIFPPKLRKKKLIMKN